MVNTVDRDYYFNDQKVDVRLNTINAFRHMVFYDDSTVLV